MQSRRWEPPAAALRWQAKARCLRGMARLGRTKQYQFRDTRTGPHIHPWLASQSKVSAWHGAVRAHQHAKSRPRSLSMFCSTCSRADSCCSGAAREDTHTNPPSNSRCNRTHSAAVPSCPTMNGLPHGVARSTLTAPSGRRQPFARDRRRRFGPVIGSPSARTGRDP